MHSLLILFFSMVTAGTGVASCAIRPATIQGVCTVCNTTSCTNCPAMGVQERVEAPPAERCPACDHASHFCTAAKSATDDAPFSSFYGPVKTAFIPRSQGTNTARELVGWEEFIHQYDVGDYYLTTGHVLSYSRSFRPERIARQLFNETVLRFAGSQVVDRGPCEILADNFGLAPTFRGQVSVCPLIENIIFDNQFFIGLDPLVCGLYARIHFPIVHTRWDLRLSQTIESKGCTPFPPCYMSVDEAQASGDSIEALSGCRTFGDMQHPWNFGRILCGPQTKTGLADIDLILGYDFRQSDTSHLGFYGQLVVPTGTRYTARELFQPMIGNGRHVELGIGCSAHAILAEYSAESNLGIYFEGTVVHMFSADQCRSFDFCDRGPLSRYLLLKEVERVGNQYRYTGNLINGIDFATRSVSVSRAGKADLSVKLAVRTPRIIADLGYNFFGQTKESLCLNGDDERQFVIKGTEGVCGLEYQTVDVPPVSFGDFVTDVPLNSSQTNATIRSGAQTDNPQSPVKLDPTNIVVTAFSRQEGPVAGPDVIEAFESAPPKVLTSHDLHICSGRLPAQATHKIFGYIGYNCFDLDWCANPYLGIGGEIEFDARSIDERTALNQWSIWLKGGFEF